MDFATPRRASAKDELNVVCWKWGDVYTAGHVNRLRDLVSRFYQHPHRFTCITDNPTGLDPRVRFVPLWDDFAGLFPVEGHGSLSCYRRLKLFSAEAASLFGPRVVSIDLDVAVTADLAPLWNRPDDFVICGGFTSKSHYNGTMFLHRTGTRTMLWDDFDPALSPLKTAEAGLQGSDQAWISHRLGQGEATWTRGDGIYSFRIDVQSDDLPKGAKLVSFHGRTKPWDLKNRALYAWAMP